MTIATNRLRGDDSSASVFALGWDPGGASTIFLSPADAQELIVDPANTPWTLSVSSNLLQGQVTMDVGAETVTLFHDIVLPTCHGSSEGWQINSFTVYYTVATASLTSATFDLVKTTLAAPPTAAVVTHTGTPTLTAGDYASVETITTPEIGEENEAYRLNLAFEMANTGVLTYYGSALAVEPVAL